jgi:hypothetical protein
MASGMDAVKRIVSGSSNWISGASVRGIVNYNQSKIQHFSTIQHIETAILDGTVDFSAPVYVENANSTNDLLKELNERLEKVQQGGGEKALKLHRSRGKMTARERIATLIDPGSPFIELSPLAGWDMYDGDCLSGGIVTGIGRVDGIEVMIVANDATVKGKLWRLTNNNIKSAFEEVLWLWITASASIL